MSGKTMKNPTHPTKDRAGSYRACLLLKTGLTDWENAKRAAKLFRDVRYLLPTGIKPVEIYIEELNPKAKRPRSTRNQKTGDKRPL